MSPALETALEAVTRLTDEEAAVVAERLLSRLGARGQLSPEWQTEISSRVEQIRSGTAELVDGDEVLARVRKMLQ